MSITSKETKITVTEDIYEFYLSDLGISTKGVIFVNEDNDDELSDFNLMINRVNQDNYWKLSDAINSVFARYFNNVDVDGFERFSSYDHQDVVIRVSKCDIYTSAIVQIKVVNTNQLEEVK